MKKTGAIAALCMLAAQAAFAQHQPVTYVPTDSLFPNPERGFYSHREVQAEGSGLTLGDLLSLRNTKGQSLILRMYYLKKFRASDLSQKQLDLLHNDFAVMRTAGVKCVLRFAYSSAETEADAPLSVVLGHLDQLKSLLEANGDVIAVVQAGFIGAWGEWYYSTNGLNNTADRRTVLNKMLGVIPADRMVQVRTPNYKMDIFSIGAPLTEQEAYTETPVARTAHHNDCFLASYDDYGTYQDTSADKAYLSQDTRFTALGGETCSPSPFSGCSNALLELARMHWTFLNSDYNSTVLSGWTTGGCMTEVQRRLGYRFELVDGLFADSVKPGGGLRARIRIANRGWAAPFNPRLVHLILRRFDDSTRYWAQLPADPRFWFAGDTTTIDVTVGVPGSMKPGTYELLLALPDPSVNLRARPEYSIRCANAGVWEPGTGYNRLGQTVTIDPSTPGEPFTDTLIFRPFDRSTGVNGVVPRPDNLLRLDGNYPNPFNGMTQISFTLARQASITLRVFDVLGQEVSPPMEKDCLPGRNDVIFDAGSLASGLYFYSLSALGSLAKGRLLHLK